MTGRRLLVAAVLALVTAGCGVPTGGEPTTIAPSDIPYGLTTPSAAPPATLAEPVADPSRVFLVASDDSLVPRARPVSGSTRTERLENLLGHLAAGPTAGERDEELSTALPPDVRLTVTDVAKGTATIDIGGAVDAPSGWATRRTVGQLVLTATSVPGIDAVRLTLAGDPVEAPLPDGELTTEPLTAEDYEVFLTPPPPPTAVPAPPGAPSAEPVPTTASPPS
jgi:spore germination protein GerM